MEETGLEAGPHGVCLASLPAGGSEAGLQKHGWEPTLRLTATALKFLIFFEPATLRLHFARGPANSVFSAVGETED